MIIPKLLMRNLLFIKVSPGLVTMPGPQEAFKSVFFFKQMNEYINFRDVQFYANSDGYFRPCRMFSIIYGPIRKNYLMAIGKSLACLVFLRNETKDQARKCRQFTTKHDH